MAIELAKVAEALIGGARIHKKAMEQIPGGEEAVRASLKASGNELTLDSSGHFIVVAKPEEKKEDAKS